MFATNTYNISISRRKCPDVHLPTDVYRRRICIIIISEFVVIIIGNVTPAVTAFG